MIVADNIVKPLNLKQLLRLLHSECSPNKTLQLVKKTPHTTNKRIEAV